MKRCQFCNDPLPAYDERINKHICITKSEEGHIHVHGDLDQTDAMKELLINASDEVGLKFGKQELTRKEFVFKNRQRIGDMFMFTCAIRDFKKAFPDTKVNVISTAMHIWDHNPYIDRSVINTPETLVEIGPSELTNASNRLDWHFANAFRISIENKLGVHIPQGESRGDIWLTQEEYDSPNIFGKPYWLICSGGEKGWGCKMYPQSYWQRFVDQNTDQNFVQIGSSEDNHPRLKGSHVIDYIGKTQDRTTGLRDLFKLFLNAEGSIGLVSFHMHLSGALYKPSIVVAGAREPVSFTRYPGHRYLATDGCIPCAATTACWKCDINACKMLTEVDGEKTPQCVEMIKPDDLTAALKQYYTGGRLVKGQISAKPKFKNIVPTPPKKVEVVVEKRPDAAAAEVDPVKKYGLGFGGGSLTDKDWEFIKDVIAQYKIKSVLEFGAGLSTLLLNDHVEQVYTLETSQAWANKISAIKPVKIGLWDGVTTPAMTKDRWDMVFVDGPAGGASREWSTAFGALSADIVIIHDAGREHEKKWQEKYLKGTFEGPGKGGHRCHLWVKASKLASIPVKTPAITPQNEAERPVPCIRPLKPGKHIKIVSTARGWGGCARSVTTIMKHLLAAGHHVEFIPFRNSIGSREFRDILAGDLKDVEVTLDYNSIPENACDVLLMYADDFIWEFGKNPIVDAAFENIGAEKKIMMLNYRRGEVGKVAWTQGWDKYMFLNSTQEKELLKVLPGAKTKVLPPCTELEEFFKVKPNYNNNLRIVRHSSQGDTKYEKETFPGQVSRILNERRGSEIHLLPGPSYLSAGGRLFKYPRVADPGSIAAFLSQGNLFWYSLPNGYMDMGPRVILEAMAAGLPILADNWGGAIDRVTPECGWLCDTKPEHVEILAGVTCAQLKTMGEASRERAKTFDAAAWVKEIVEV